MCQPSLKIILNWTGSHQGKIICEMSIAYPNGWVE